MLLLDEKSLRRQGTNMIVRNSSAVAVRAGFTLMEMLVVVAILVVLAGIGGYYYLQHVDDAKKDAAAMQVKTLTKAAQAYKLHNDDFPQSLDQLLVKSPSGKGPYLEDADALIDPWGQPYRYDKMGARNNGLKPDIYSESVHGVIGNWAQKVVN